MALQSDFRTYSAEAAIGPYLIVKPGTGVRSCILAAAGADFALGVSDGLTKAIGESVDVGMGPIGEVTLGATVVAGAPLMSDANGKAITATAAAGVNVRIIGFAEQAGVLNDVITFLREPGMFQG